MHPKQGVLSLRLGLSIAATLLFLPVHAYARSWTIGGGGGVLERGVVSTTKDRGLIYRDRTDGVVFASIVDVLRGSDGHLTIAGHTAYIPYGDGVTHAHHLVVGVGLRYSPRIRREHGGAPYVELSPALVWSNWKSELYGTYLRSAVHPGVIASVGVEGRVAGRVGMDFAVRYFLSADAQGQQAHTTSQTLKGLRQIGVAVGVNYSI